MGIAWFEGKNPNVEGVLGKHMAGGGSAKFSIPHPTGSKMEYPHLLGHEGGELWPFLKMTLKLMI